MAKKGKPTIAHFDQHKANKEHRCDICGKTIPVGMEYITRCWYCNEGYKNIKLHIHCDAFYTTFRESDDWKTRTRESETIQWLMENHCFECDKRDKCDLVPTECSDLMWNLLNLNTVGAAKSSAKALQKWEETHEHE